MIRILSDSTSDIPFELRERYGIRIIPLHVNLGEKEYRDGIDITPDELYAWSDTNNATPKTSAPAIEDILEAFREVLTSGDEAIVFTISSLASASMKCMLLGVEELGTDKITVIDSANLTTGMGMLVLEAAIMAENGRTREEIKKRIEVLKPLIRTSFVVDTLVYLHRGGRCSGLSAFLGGTLKLHPRIGLADGAMSPGKKYRGKMDKIIMDYVTDMEEAIKNSDENMAFIVHSGGVEEECINAVNDYLAGLNHFKNIYIQRAGSVISSHCGPGTLGVIFMAKES